MIIFFLLICTNSCHTPLDPEKEKSLATIEGIVLGGISVDVKIDGNPRNVDELQWFSELLVDSTNARLMKAKSFRFIRSINLDSLPLLPEQSDSSVIAHDKALKLSEQIISSINQLDTNQALIIFHYRLSDGSIKDNLILKNKGIALVILPSREMFVASTSERFNYQPHLPTKMPSFEDMVRFVFIAGLSEENWIDILNAESQKENTLLPISTGKLIDLLEHRIEVARGKQKLSWIEIVKTSDWKKTFQFKQAGIAFLFWLICLAIAGIVGSWTEKSEARPGKIIAVAAAIGSFYFLYFILAAIL